MVLPRERGVFIRAGGPDLELVAGQWALIPPFARSPRLGYSTNNARSEELADKASYRQAWAGRAVEHLDELQTGQIHESYTMLTVNTDAHPLMRRMHKPKPGVPADRQDKRSVIAIEQADVDRWLRGSQQEVQELLRALAVDLARQASADD